VILGAAAYDKAFNKGISLTYPNGTVDTFNIRDKMKRGNFSQGFNIGLDFNIDLGNGFSVVNKGRYQDMIVGTQFDFPLTSTYGATQNRVLFVGNSLTDGGSRAKDLINEIRLQKTIEQGDINHSLTAGYYYSNIDVRAAAIGHWYNINTGVGASRADSIRGAVGFFGPNPTFATTLFRNGTYNENVNSVFFGDEMKVGDNLTINFGFRYDRIGLDLSEDRYTFPIQRNANRQITHTGWNASFGMNYLLDNTSALYMNYVRAYRAPDYSAYTTVVYAKYTRDTLGRITGITNLTAADNQIQTDGSGRTLYTTNYIDKNEIINSFEVGYRNSGDDISFDGGLFMNMITDRLVSTFIGATAVQIPGGDNLIAGAEINMYYAPQSVKGLYARAGITLQKTEYLRLAQAVNATTIAQLGGNKVAGVPSGIYNFSVGYERKGFNVNLNTNTLAGRPVDPFNTVYYPVTTVADANASYRYKMKNASSLMLKLSVTNLLNTQAAANVVSGSTDSFYKLARDNGFAGNFINVRGVPQLPRRLWASVEFNF
jgi:outer membrane receptor protein involved in Fe transport